MASDISLAVGDGARRVFSYVKVLLAISVSLSGGLILGFIADVLTSG
jgi:hypothetical protein